VKIEIDFYSIFVKDFPYYVWIENLSDKTEGDRRVAKGYIKIR
jgi:hypothetical protein